MSLIQGEQVPALAKHVLDELEVLGRKRSLALLEEELGNR